MPDFSERLACYQVLQSQILQLHPSLRTRLDDLERLNGGFAAIDRQVLNREITEEEASTARAKLGELLRTLEHMEGEGEVPRLWNHLQNEKKTNLSGLSIPSPSSSRSRSLAPSFETPEDNAALEARKVEWLAGGVARPTDRKSPQEKLAEDRSARLSIFRKRLRRLDSELKKRGSEIAFDIKRWGQRLCSLWKEARAIPVPADMEFPTLPERITNEAEAAEAVEALAGYFAACQVAESDTPQESDPPPGSPERVPTEPPASTGPDGPFDPFSFRWKNQVIEFCKSERRYYRLLTVIWSGFRLQQPISFNKVNDRLRDKGRSVGIPTLKNYASELSAILTGRLDEFPARIEKDDEYLRWQIRPR